MVMVMVLLLYASDAADVGVGVGLGGGLNTKKKEKQSTKLSCLFSGFKIEEIEPRLFSEDFSIMSNDKPGCFVLMGNGIEGSNRRPLHAADYDFNDELLVIGSSY